MPQLCPACGGADAARWRLAHPVERGLPVEPGLPLLRCRGCGSAWLADPPGPDPAELHQTGAYAPGTGLVERLPRQFRQTLDRDRIRLLGPLEPGSRVIEVGSGRGRLLSALRGRGHDASGVEPSGAPESGPGLPEGAVQRVAVEDAVFPPGEADVVVLWHSLEHLESPSGALDRAKGWLRPGGRLVLAVPNLSSVQAGLGGDRWFHQDVPRHRTQFTLAGVLALARRSGFEPRGVSQLMLEQNVLGMWLTLLNRLTFARDVPFRALKRDLSYPRRADAVRDTAVASLAGPLLLPVAVAAELVAGLARRGGTVVVRSERS